MFYCDKCRVENHWPKGFMRSFGPCEICEERAECHDVPSSALPDPVTMEELERLLAPAPPAGQ